MLLQTLALKLFKEGSKLKKRCTQKLDLRGLLLSLMLLKVSQTFRALQPGETLEVLWGDADIPENLFKVLPAASYEVISMEKLGKIKPYYRIQLQKTEQSQTGLTFGLPLEARNNL